MTENEEASIEELTEIIQEQNERIENLEQRVSDLESTDQNRRDAVISSQSASKLDR